LAGPFCMWRELGYGLSGFVAQTDKYPKFREKLLGKQHNRLYIFDEATEFAKFRAKFSKVGCTVFCVRKFMEGYAIFLIHFGYFSVCATKPDKP